MKLQTQAPGQTQEAMMTATTMMMARSSLSHWRPALILLSFQPQSALALALLLLLLLHLSLHSGLPALLQGLLLVPVLTLPHFLLSCPMPAVPLTRWVPPSCS